MHKGLIEHFETLPDPRIDRTKRYPLMEIILLIIAGTVSGCDGWKSLKDFGEAKLDWLRKFLPYKDGIPVDDTLARVMRKIETKSFQACFMKWVESVSEATSGDVVAIDGKTPRQCGKTTLSKQLYDSYDYFNYDAAASRLALNEQSWGR